MVTHVTLHLGPAEYAIPSSRVQGIVSAKEYLPDAVATPPIRGTLNVGGREFPVVDLRTKVGLGSATPGPKACIVLVDLPAPRPVRIGLLVDRVSQVFPIEGPVDQIPSAAEWIIGITKYRRRTKTIIDLDRMFTQPEIEQLSQIIR